MRLLGYAVAGAYGAALLLLAEVERRRLSAAVGRLGCLSNAEVDQLDEDPRLDA